MKLVSIFFFMKELWCKFQKKKKKLKERNLCGKIVLLIFAFPYILCTTFLIICDQKNIKKGGTAFLK